MPSTDSIDRVPYRIGYSFKEPDVVKPITFQRRNPFFTMTWAGRGPTDVQRDLWASGQTRRFPTVWRRAAKSQTSARLGEIRSELPDFTELGAAPGPTDSSGSGTVERNVWGSLANDLLTAGGEVIQQAQQLQMVKAQAAAQQQQYGGMFPNIRVMPSSDGGLGMIGWGAIILGVGAAGYYFMKR